MKKTLVLTGALFVLMLSLYSCVSNLPVGGSYPSIRIGPDTTLLPSGVRSPLQPNELSFFNYSRGAFIFTVDHMVRDSLSAPLYRVFYMDGSLQDDKLDRTVKTSELLRGEFGSISLKKTCFYNRSFDFNLNTVAIGRYDERSEPAKSVDPPAAQNAPTSFALLRVFRDGDGAAVVTGDYEADGKLRSLHIDHTRSGARLFYPGDGIFMDPSSKLQMARQPNPIGVGLPLTLQFEFNGFMRLPATSFPVAVEALFTVYADGSLVREDVLAEGQNGFSVLKETRYLQPSVVDEQRQLEPACTTQLAKQRTAQKRTVE